MRSSAAGHPFVHEDNGTTRTAKADSAKAIRDYVTGLTEEELEENVDYEFIGGNRGSLPRHLIITHLALHGNYHREFSSQICLDRYRIPSRAGYYRLRTSPPG